MGVGSTFTQLDLLAGHLKYRLMSGGDLRNRRKPVEDGFKFKVETKEQARQGVEAFRCIYFTLVMRVMPNLRQPNIFGITSQEA